MIQTTIFKFTFHLSEKLYAVHLCFVDLKGKIEDKDIVRFLSVEEMQYYRSNLYSKRKQDYCLSRMATKEAILRQEASADIKNICVRNGVFNQPLVKGMPTGHLEVSLAHSGCRAASLVFSNEIMCGLDIELLDESKCKTVYSILSDKELGLLEGTLKSEKLHYLVALWTAKEAMSKAIKTGFTVDMKALEISHIQKVSHHFDIAFDYFPLFRALSFVDDDYVSTVVFPKSIEPVQVEKIA